MGLKSKSAAFRADIRTRRHLMERSFASRQVWLQTGVLEKALEGADSGICYIRHTEHCSSFEV